MKEKIFYNLARVQSPTAKHTLKAKLPYILCEKCKEVCNVIPILKVNLIHMHTVYKDSQPACKDITILLWQEPWWSRNVSNDSHPPPTRTITASPTILTQKIWSVSPNRICVCKGLKNTCVLRKRSLQDTLSSREVASLRKQIHLFAL